MKRSKEESRGRKGEEERSSETMRRKGGGKNVKKEENKERGKTETEGKGLHQRMEDWRKRKEELKAEERSDKKRRITEI